MKLKDLLTRRLLGEPMPERFTSVDGRCLIAVDELRISDSGIEIVCAETVTATVKMPDGSSPVNHLKANNIVTVHLDGHFIEIKLA